MFHKLTFDVTFPSTGRRLTQNLDLHAGFWAITGPNESGKSFIFEMLRYSLFGSIALRGKAEDYKNLKVSSEFTLKGDRYSVVRTAKTAELKRGGDIVATGVTTVNSKIVETMGFGISVFDMACSINQGEVERLGSLTPSERKKLIDGVLGIDALDIVGKWAMDEARLLDREADAINNIAPEPVPIPEGYVPSDQIHTAVAEAEVLELGQIEGFLSVHMAQPEKPSCDLPTVEELTPLAEQAAEMRRIQARIDVLPSEAYSNEVLDQAEEFWKATRWLAEHPEPILDRATLQQILATHDRLATFREQQRIKARIKEIEDHQSVCPACDHHFGDEVLLSELQAQLVDVEEPEAPAMTQENATRILKQWETFDADKHAAMKAVPAVEVEGDITRLRRDISLVAERERLVARYVEMPDYEGQLIQRRAYDQSLGNYETALTAYQTWLLTREEKLARECQLTGCRERLSALRDNRDRSRAYESQLEQFQAAMGRYMDGQVRFETLKTQAAEHRKIRDAMNVLKSMIKQHVIPSLNRVASHLISQMTGGQRNIIWVDEDFNVTVDGQDLSTLSGSGKGCANLSLRIALGQVLTNRVFSVLLADEIDAAMDDFRAEKTSKVLCTLENSICQIMQVSHKLIESVNQIDLGGIREPNQPGEAA